MAQRFGVPERFDEHFASPFWSGEGIEFPAKRKLSGQKPCFVRVRPEAHAALEQSEDAQG